VQPIQIAALKYFLKIKVLNTKGYDVEAGVVIFSFIHGDYKMKVVFGDELYCCLNKEVIAATNCEDDCAKVSSARVYHDAYL